RDRLAPLEANDLVDLLRPLEAARLTVSVVSEGAPVAIGRLRVDIAGEERPERPLVRDSRRAERAHGRAVVAPVAADDLVLARVAGLLVVLPGPLEPPLRCPGAPPAPA